MQVDNLLLICELNLSLIFYAKITLKDNLRLTRKTFISYKIILAVVTFYPKRLISNLNTLGISVGNLYGPVKHKN